MPRRKPISGKQHKAELQLKRAVKRGDAPAPDPAAKKPSRRKPRPARIGPTGQTLGTPNVSTSIIESAKRLQSAFIKLPPKFLEETKYLAATLTLPRPIPTESTILEEKRSDVSDVQLKALTCPKRPKWKYDMTKKEVEKNEEGIFKKWLAATDEVIMEWQKGHEDGDNGSKDKTGEIKPKVKVMPRSPSYFERNLEVWRQLWRVTEISEIILVLLDSRAPLLHLPPSLSTYLSSLPTPSHPLKIILALTKVDITGPVRVAAWTRYFERKHPGIKVVQVEAYQEKAEGAGKQGRKMYEPHLPDSFRKRLVSALREVHEEMLVPPTRLNGDKEKVLKWEPRVRRVVDWESVLTAGGGIVGSIVGGAAAPRSEVGEDEREGEPEFLTIGLIGQPNVGKSSLLNALFGTHKVRASRTPGKTKHFQTHFWTPQVRLVDCPGLVMPNFVPMEMQVMSGILPISHVSAIPSCVHLISSLMPIERIFNLVHPSLSGEKVEDKRTWRDGVRPSNAQDGREGKEWTAMDILTAYADKKGWVTAKAGRSDVMRAGNALLRNVAEGRVGWGLWPPESGEKLIEEEMQDNGSGVWIPRVDADNESEYESESEEEVQEDEASENGSGSESSESEEDEAQELKVVGMGMFGALSLDEST